MPQRPPPSSGTRVLHFSRASGNPASLIQQLAQHEPENEHVFAPRVLEAARRGSIGKNALGVTNGRVERHRQVQMERAYIAQVTRLQNPDLVIFHTPTQDEVMARIAVGALHGTRQRMMVYRYDAKPVQRGVLRRIILSRISLWVVPTRPAGMVLEAAGIDRERIRVLRPPVQQPRPMPQKKAQQILGIPSDKPVVTVISPTPTEVALLTPTLELMQNYEQGYTLVVADLPSEAATAIEPLVEGSQGQAVLVETEYCRAPTIDILEPTPLKPVLMPTKPTESETLVAASDAQLVLDWSISVRRPTIQTMMGEREILTMSSEESEEVTGGEATFIDAATPAQVTSSLTAYTPDPAKGRDAAVFAREEYDAVKRASDHSRTYADALPVRAKKRGRTPAA